MSLEPSFVPSALFCNGSFEGGSGALVEDRLVVEPHLVPAHGNNEYLDLTI